MQDKMSAIEKTFNSLFLMGVVFALGYWTFTQYAHLGFNPTDEGLVLGYARRMLEGQIPHRDFISVLPVGFTLFHIPILKFFPDHTFLASRGLAILQMCTVCLAWIIFIPSFFKNKPSLLLSTILLIWSFIISIHNFPLMSWYTIDGIFLITFGYIFLSSRFTVLQMIGIFLIGFAGLCKHNFFALVPILIFLGQKQKRLDIWFCGILPGILYLIYLGANNAIGDAIAQLTGHASLVRTGFFRYYKSPHFILGVVLSSVMLMAWSNKSIRAIFSFTKIKVTLEDANYSNNVKRLSKYVPGLLFAFLLFFLSWRSSQKYFFWEEVLIIFGMIFVVGLFEFAKSEDSKISSFMLATFAMAWAVSISVGYNTPALFSGQIWAALVIYFYSIWSETQLFSKFPSRLSGLVLIPFLVWHLQGWDFTRKNKVYREKGYSELVVPVPNIIKGGEGIYTNQLTASFIADLSNAIDLVLPAKYAIVPEFSAFWATSEQLNPLSNDWPQPVQLPTEAIRQRIYNDLDRHVANGGKILLQKFSMAQIRHGKEPIEDTFTTVNYVKEKFQKERETEFFEIYIAKSL